MATKDTTGSLFTPEQPDLLEASYEEQLAKRKSQPVECLGQTFPSDQARREHFLTLLREKLQDPEFRKQPGFPIGEDKDILRLSDPPYYTACPNPFLGGACSGSIHGDIAHVNEPYSYDVSEGKTDPIYIAHSYHTKVPPLAISRYILWYTKPGDIVLDAYSGSGMTGVAASICGAPSPQERAKIEREATLNGNTKPEWGRRTVILNDIAPAATFIAHGYNHIGNSHEVRREVLQALRETLHEFGYLYETEHCGWPAGERDPARWVNASSSKGKGSIILTIWSEVMSCPECGREITLWPDALDPNKASIKDKIECQRCGVQSSKLDLRRIQETVWDNVIEQPVVRNKFSPAFIVYEFDGKRYEKVPDDNDKITIEKSFSLPKHVGIATSKMMHSDGIWGHMFRSGYHKGMSHIHHFFTERNWAIFSALWSRCSEDGSKFVLTSLINRLSKMSSLHMKNFFNGGGGFAAGNTKGNLYIPSLFIEQSPFAFLEERLTKALKAFEREGRGWNYITTGSAERIPVQDSVVDYIFIDPPFGQNIIYSELNFMWESLISVFTNNDREAIVDNFRKKGLAEYQGMMRAGFKELFRVLKPGKWMTLEFHNSQNSVWAAIQEALQSTGFVVADVRVLDKKQGSHKQNVAGGAVKSDLVISAYKPPGEMEKGFSLQSGTADGVWSFVSVHLGKLPIFVKNRDESCDVIAERRDFMLFDRAVAYHLQHGVTFPMTAAEFYAGLEARYACRDQMYFRHDQVDQFEKNRALSPEIRQLELIPYTEATTIQWLRQELTKKPRGYAELQPEFMRLSVSWEKHEMRIELMDILEQNFLRYDGNGEVPSQIHAYLSSNYKDFRNMAKDDPELRAKAKDRWFVPDPNKLQDLEAKREKQLLREFDELLASKEKRIKHPRHEVIRAGFKRAWGQKDYATIKAIAAKIPDEVIQEDQQLLMWYDMALTRLGDDSF